jgi:hypothetical protein
MILTLSQLLILSSRSLKTVSSPFSHSMHGLTSCGTIDESSCLEVVSKVGGNPVLKEFKVDEGFVVGSTADGLAQRGGAILYGMDLIEYFAGESQAS